MPRRSIGVLEIKDRGEEEKDCRSKELISQLRSKELIKVFKVKIFLEKKNPLRGEINSRSISVDTCRGRMHMQFEHLRIRDHQKWWTSIHTKVKRSDLIFISKFQIVYIFFLLDLDRIRFDLFYVKLKGLTHLFSTAVFKIFEIYICCLSDFLTVVSKPQIFENIYDLIFRLDLKVLMI